MLLRNRGVWIALGLSLVAMAGWSCNFPVSASPSPAGTKETKASPTKTQLTIVRKPTATTVLTPTETPTITPTSPPRLFAKMVVAGLRSSCVITLSGGVKCWGYNLAGRLGDGTDINRRYPVDVVGLSSGVVDIGLWDDFACVLTTAGGVKCWGGNGLYGTLGDNRASGEVSFVPVDVVGLSTGVIDIAVGGYHACALLETGGVKCWGNSGGNHVIGTESTSFSPIPVDVIGLSSGAIAISAGDDHTCALMNTGGVKCWGTNQVGELGEAPDYTQSHHKLVDVKGLSGIATAIAAGYQATCAIMENGGVMCWGDKYELGNGTGVDSATPIDVPGLEDAVISISANNDICVVMHNGGLKCWGGGPFIPSDDQYSTPTDIPGLEHGVSSVSVGAAHACVIMEDGGVKCMGYNGDGELGNGAPSDNVLPPGDVICPYCGSAILPTIGPT